MNTIYSSGVGENTIDGGTGTNTVSYENAPEAIAADFSKGPGTVKSSGIDALTNIQAVVGSPFDDTFIPGPDDETFDGGGGTNTLSYQDQAPAEGTVSPTLPDPATVDLAAGTASAPGRGKDKLLNVQNVIGSPYDDILLGDAHDNVLDGREGNDFIDGRAGNDTLLGGPGNDILYGGPGNDVLNGGDGDDKESGDDGDDRFDQEVVKNGADTLSGGPGTDTVDYYRRHETVTVSKNGAGLYA